MPFPRLHSALSDLPQKSPTEIVGDFNLFLVGQQVLGAVAGVDIVGLEAFCVCHAALVAAVLGTGTHHVCKVDIVMLTHPLQLGLMALQSLQLGLDLVCDVHIMGGLEVDACQSIHKEGGKPQTFWDGG